MSDDVFWPHATDADELLYEIRNGSTREYVESKAAELHRLWSASPDQESSKPYASDAFVARIQSDFADDLADREGDLYEQIKDLIAQFHVEREIHEANALDLRRCRDILAQDIIGEAFQPLPPANEPLPIDSVAFSLYAQTQELRWWRAKYGESQ